MLLLGKLGCLVPVVGPRLAPSWNFSIAIDRIMSQYYEKIKLEAAFREEPTGRKA